MDAGKRRWLILLALAAVIIGGSFWSYRQKTAVTARPAPAVVQVSGAVNKPGLYRVEPQSRVADAVNAAGGLADGADVGGIDLTLKVKDGMEIYVPVRAPAGGGPAAAGKVSINAAGKDELDKLPGIGPVLAGRIVEYRRVHGPFKAVSDIKKVSGIGEAKFNRLKDKITL